jgi:GNAT superfamily N-acetyltransferase
MSTERITVEEFHLQFRRVGWKHELIDGITYTTPGHAVVCVTIEVGRRPAPRYPHIRRPVEADSKLLVEGFIASFEGSADFHRSSLHHLSQSAQESIDDFFKGKEGEPDEASRIALCETGTEVIGAALVVRKRHGHDLDLLFVRPEYRRQGIATDLVNAAINDLHDRGIERLTSSYLLANEPSGEWHRRFGFHEEMDLQVTRWRWTTLRHNIRVHKLLADVDASALSEMESEESRLREETERLEEIQKRDGYKAVCALLRRDESDVDE